MKKLVLYFLLLSAPFAVHAQFDRLKDSVVQIYGVIMTADSLRAIPAVSIVVKGRNQGTFSNDQGVFSIVVVKGDQIEFTSIGYKPIVYKTDTVKGNQISMIQLMVVDAQYLPSTIIAARPTREQFERDFVNTKVPDDGIEIARQNNDAAKRRILSRSLPHHFRIRWRTQSECLATVVRRQRGRSAPHECSNPRQPRRFHGFRSSQSRRRW